VRPLAERIRAVKLVIFDVDGVLTDGRIVLNDDGVESKFFDVRDGSGIKWLVRVGLDVAFLTGRQSHVVEVRAAELGVTRIHQGAKVKIDIYERLLNEAGLQDEAVAYAGDDLIDLPVMRRVGLALAPADARPEVKAAAHYVCREGGGRGAVREIVELILKGQGFWEQVTAPYFSPGFSPG
jgi:3-deoxy-D-manno-octulosonate 8-phosphate phosphatase (KDO 8-P phosphatase)